MHRKTAVAVSGAALLLAGVTTSTAQAAPTAAPSARTMGTCPVHANARVNGAIAAWSLKCHSPEYVSVNGNFKDTKADGKCARVKIVTAYVTKRHTACGKGKVERFSYLMAAKRGVVKVYLSVV
ncbi:hypothetical protein ACFYVL_40960 [Streptomyces sp. NPDC004111]|uniref:hypothetical protein n=1 Tax=Streptomyces sp. NPDC004111 TaxID=3364690 RepID=UPI0036CC184C